MRGDSLTDGFDLCAGEYGMDLWAVASGKGALTVDDEDEDRC